MWRGVPEPPTCRDHALPHRDRTPHLPHPEAALLRAPAPGPSSRRTLDQACWEQAFRPWWFQAAPWEMFEPALRDLHRASPARSWRQRTNPSVGLRRETLRISSNEFLFLTLTSVRETSPDCNKNRMPRAL